MGERDGSQRNKKHEVFEPFFDRKECNDERLVEQKLNYIDENASRGEDRLVESPADYDHSSAKFYISGEKASVPITNTCSFKKSICLIPYSRRVPKEGDSAGKKEPAL